MKVLADIPFKLDLNDLLKQNRIKEETDHAVEFQSLFDMAEKAGKPKALFKECFIDKKGTDTVSIDGTAFKSHVLRKNLDSIERVFAYVVTCGKEVDTIEIFQGNFLKEYWLDTIKQSLLDFSKKYLEEHLFQKYNINKTASMQPGSGDISVWPIEQQKELFSLFGDVEKFIGVRLTESFLMFPVKSISGIIFPTQVDFKSCELCYRKKCPRRRLPFNKDLWKSMQQDEA
ncbi:MAG: hypothetical protein K8S13_20320 [Desulfobacula sp.]|uniref:vitamin B12 dependent-methionine synthase activation domain-containing protein n=1 Tax=Desulfobacula sp. TaxID=2593537 RepID=UPI0025BA74F6|nr:vitamin B12 dependent-methionine synthase activation domain-containing protein [Desulfobacula sp.]MCD4722182.1 hypothetical protein [Desulfobacula sp.]